MFMLVQGIKAGVYSVKCKTLRVISGKKKFVFPVRWPTLIFGPTLNFFMALLGENYLNTLGLPSNVVFDV